MDCKHEDGFELLLGGIEQLADAQSPRVPVPSQHGEFDVQRILVQELITLVAATCLNAESWRLLNKLGARSFAFRFEFADRSGNFVRLVQAAESMGAYEQANRITAGFGIGRLLKERYSGGGLGGVRFEQLREADFFLYELTELEPPQKQDFFRWIPPLFPLGDKGSTAIGWIRRCKSASWLEKVAGAMGMNVATFKSRYEERWAHVAEIFRESWWSLGHDLNWILIEPKDLGTQS